MDLILKIRSETQNKLMLTKKNLKLVKPVYKDDIEIITTGDYNDGDHLTSETIVTLAEYEELLPIMRSIIKARKARKPWHNWEDKEEYLSENDIEVLEKYLNIPSGADVEIHSIVSFDVSFLSKEDTVRYKVNF